MNIEEKLIKFSQIIREKILKSHSLFSRWPPYPKETDVKCVVRSD